jgi:hypothetical protein
MKHLRSIIGQCFKEDAQFLKRTKQRARFHCYVSYVLTSNTGKVATTARKDCTQYVNQFRWTAF